MRMMLWTVLLTSLGLALGCAADASGEGTMDANGCSGKVPTYAELTIFQKCSMCHSSQLAQGQPRMQSPININFDTEPAADAAAVLAVQEVKADAMPPKASGITVTDAEKQALYTWAECMAK